MAIDPSTTSLGWAAIDRSHEFRYGVITLDPKLLRHDRFYLLYEELEGLFSVMGPEFTVYNRPFARGQDATRCGWGAAGLIEAKAARWGSAVTDIYEAAVRRFFGIFDDPAYKAAKTRAKRRKVLKSLSLDKARTLCNNDLESDDIADAVLALYYTLMNSEVK